MRTIIAGSRDITDAGLVALVVESAPWEITSVICGMARGVDTLGAAWARARGIPVVEYPADWLAHGRAAGAIRNSAMAAAADALIVIRYPHSRGSADITQKARARKLVVLDHVLDGR